MTVRETARTHQKKRRGKKDYFRFLMLNFMCHLKLYVKGYAVCLAMLHELGHFCKESWSKTDMASKSFSQECKSGSNNI